MADVLTDAEERDWRVFAFAKTREGDVWGRASVQRLFATIDALRERRNDCARENDRLTNKVLGLEVKCDELINPPVAVPGPVGA